MATYPVKYFTSAMRGAPALAGAAGSLLAVLDACLIDGFGSVGATGISVAGGIATATVNSGDGFTAGAIVTVAGATPAELNGEQRVLTATATQLTFATTAADGAATGTITIKVAPIGGWQKAYTKPNVAVYRSTDVLGTRAYLRVDDSNAFYARVAMYESMSDVDTGVGLAPSAAMVSGGYYWHKRQSGAAAGWWALIGDSRGFYWCPAPAAASSAAKQNRYMAVPQYFGDINSNRSGDAWCAALTGALSANYSAVDGDVFQPGAVNGRVLARASHGIGGAIASARMSWGVAGISGIAGGMGAFPSRTDNGVQVAPIVLSDGPDFSAGPRGELPGALHCTQTAAASLQSDDLTRTDGSGAFAGRVLVSILVGSPSTTASPGVALWDATGPWRP